VKQFYYVPTDECKDLISLRDKNSDQESWQSFYFVFAKSIGL